MSKKLSEFSDKDYEIISRVVRYQGVFCLAQYLFHYRLFEGGWSNKICYEVLERKAAVGILLYDPFLEKVVLIEQFRVGALHKAKHPWVLEVVAGLIDKDEKPEQVAIREAEEEAGCKVLDLHPICDYFVSPGGSNEYLYLYCGRIDANKAGGIHGLVEENEDIRSIVFSTEEAFRLLEDGDIKTAPAILSLQWLQLNQERLKKLWLKK